MSDTRIYHDDGFVDLSENAELAHRTFMREFDEQFVPLMAEAGYTRGEALNYWMQNQIIIRLDELLARE